MEEESETPTTLGQPPGETSPGGVFQGGLFAPWPWFLSWPQGHIQSFGRLLCRRDFVFDFPEFAVFDAGAKRTQRDQAQPAALSETRRSGNRKPKFLYAAHTGTIIHPCGFTVSVKPQRPSGS